MARATGEVVYVDASPQVVRLLGEMAMPAAMRVHAGDPSPDRLRELLAPARVVLNGHTYMSAGDLAAAPHLERIVFLGTGASSYIDLDVAAARGIAVETIRNYGDRAVAQHAVALALAALRRIAPMDRALRRGEWEPLAGREFQDLTFGVVGLGGIGRAAASLAAGLGFRVLGWNRTPLPDAPCALAPLDALLERSDVVSLHLALTPQTSGLIGRQALARMRPDAVLVNTARAGLVDTGAMLAALESGRLAHAALDVFDLEPLPPDDPLLRLDTVTLTSHAGYKTDAAMHRLLQAALALIG